MSAGRYHLRAQDCRDNAELTSDPVKQANWLDLAGKWQRLALEVELRQLNLWGVCERSDELCASGVGKVTYSARIPRHL